MPRRVATLASDFAALGPMAAPALKPGSQPLGALPAADTPVGELVASSGSPIAALSSGERMFGELAAADTPVGELVASSGSPIAALSSGERMFGELAAPSPRADRAQIADAGTIADVPTAPEVAEQTEQIVGLPAAGVTMDEFPIAEDSGSNEKEATPHPASSPVDEISPEGTMPPQPVSAEPSAESQSTQHISSEPMPSGLEASNPVTPPSLAAGPVSGITGWRAGDAPSNIIEF